MKEILLQLIEDDIRITRLVRALGGIEIDASVYLPGKSTVILRLLEISDTHQREELSDAYFQRVEQASDPSSGTTDHHRAAQILDWLISFTRTGRL